MLGAEGDGFAIAQGRLGPGRMHYAMRAIGMAERALELMCRRSLERNAFGGPLADRGVVREWIARSRIEIDQIRLLVLKSSWLMDTRGQCGGALGSRRDQSGRHGGRARRGRPRGADLRRGGGQRRHVLARMYAITRALQIADGPNEVHLRTIARLEVKKYR